MAQVIFTGPSQPRQNPFSQIAQAGTTILDARNKKQVGQDIQFALEEAIEGGEANFAKFLGQPGIIQAIQTDPKTFEIMFDALGKLKGTEFKERQVTALEKQTETGKTKVEAGIEQGAQRIEQFRDKLEADIEFRESQLRIKEEQFKKQFGLNEEKFDDEAKARRGALDLQNERLELDKKKLKVQKELKEEELEIKKDIASKGARVATPLEVKALEEQFGNFPGGTLVQVLKDGQIKITPPKTSGGKITLIDKEGNITFAEGDAAFLSTVGTRGKAQERILFGQQLISQLETAQRILKKDGGVVGVGGVLRAIKNITLGQLDERFIDKNRELFQDTIRIARITAQRQISQDTRFTDADRDFIFELFPSLGILEVPALAKIRMDILEQMFLTRMGNDARSLGVDPNITPTLSKEVIGARLKGLVESGLMGKAEAKEILLALYPKDFKRAPN